jgi:hypothetical protein
LGGSRVANCDGKGMNVALAVACNVGDTPPLIDPTSTDDGESNGDAVLLDVEAADEDSLDVSDVATETELSGDAEGSSRDETEVEVEVDGDGDAEDEEDAEREEVGAAGALIALRSEGDGRAEAEVEEDAKEEAVVSSAGRRLTGGGM